MNPCNFTTTYSSTLDGHLVPSSQTGWKNNVFFLMNIFIKIMIYRRSSLLPPVPWLECWERDYSHYSQRPTDSLLVREILSRWVLGVVCPKTCHMLGSRDSSLSARAGAAAFPPCEGGVVPASGNLDLTCPTSPCLNITHQAIRTLHSTQRVSFQIIIQKKHDTNYTFCIYFISMFLVINKKYNNNKYLLQNIINTRWSLS